MKTAVLIEPGRLEIKEAEVPSPGPGEVLVKVKYCGICTLEQRLFRGDMKIFYPIIPGHEVSGEVAECGKGTLTSFAPGDRVAVDMVYRCHECYFCRNGQSNLCENRFSKGVTPLGGFSEYILVRPQQLYSIPANLSMEEAAFAEPASCCLRSLKKLNVAIAEDVLIVGAGPMGLLHLQAARASGARVIVSDPDASRLETARLLGADEVCDPSACELEGFIKDLTGGRGADVCIVTSPAASALDSAFRAVRKNGRINIYTAYTGEVPSMPVNLNTIHRSELLVTGTEGRTETDFQQAVRLLAFGRINVKPLISLIVGFEGLAEGIKAACGSETQRVLLGTEI